MQEIEFRAMGCKMHGLIDSDGPSARAALSEVPGRFERWEQCLSRFRADSELSRLNGSPGRPVRVSEALWEVIRLSLRAAAGSDGMITPTVLNALEAAGYERSQAEAVPAGLLAFDRPVPRPRVQIPEWREVRLDPDRRRVMLPPGVRLDLAGVGKGWAAEQSVRFLARTAPALVEASGDIAVSGPRADGSPWAVDIEHPFGRSDDLPLLLLRDYAVATSTVRYHRWLREGRWQHHLIDPRTGRPAETDVLSATAVAPTLPQAEVAAKMALILGSAHGLDWIEERPEYAVLLILENQTVVTSSRFSDHCWSA